MANKTINVTDASITGDISDTNYTGKIDTANFTGSVTYSEEAPVEPPIEPPIEPPSGNWAPPSWMKTDTKTYQPPNTPKPGYLVETKDPTFGTKIIRITGDQGTAIRNISGAKWGNAARHHYNTDQAWNADGTLLYLDKNEGPGAAGPNGVFLDGNNYEPKFSPKNYPYQGDVRWHATDPSVMVYVALNRIGIWNPKTGVQNDIQTFSGYDELTYGGWSGTLSTDGKMLCATGVKNGRAVGFAFNIETKKKYPDIFLDQLYPQKGDWSLYISSKGSYVVAGVGVDEIRTLNLDGSLVHKFPSNYLSHGDTMTDKNGDEVIVARANGEPSNVPGGCVNKWRLRDGTRTELSHGSWASHTSARYQKDYCVSDTFPDSAAPYLSEIYMCALDGSKVYRIAHHHNKSEEYISQPQPSHSRDGGRVVFASAWGASGDRPVSCYIADFRK